MRLLCGLGGVLAVMTASAAAQMSVTTIGATDAAACYQNAQDEFSQDTTYCDIALTNGATTRADRKKTLVNRGVIYNRAGALDKAIADFNAALDIDDDLAEAFLNRGNSYFLMSRFDDALADYHRALELDVSKPWAAWYNIGLVYAAKKQPDKAREAYEKALEINPNFTLARDKVEGRN